MENKKGQVAFYLFMLFVVFIVLALSISNPLTKSIDEVKGRIIIAENFTDVSTGLIGYYKLNENGIQIRDYSNKTGNATVVNAKFNSSGKINGGYSFNLTSNMYINITNNSLYNFNNTNFSIAFWGLSNGFNNQGSVWNCFISRGNPFDATGYGICYDSTNKTSAYSGNVNANSGISFQQSKWTHYTMVVDSNSKNISIYVNGSLYAVSTNYENNLTNVTNTLMWIGGNPGNSRYVNGSIDDVRIYNITLTQDEINVVYNLGVGTEDDSHLLLNQSILYNIDCDEVNSTDYQNRAVCTQLDSFPWFFVLIILGLAFVIIGNIGRGN